MKKVKSKICYLYRHRRLDTNEIFYVGIGSSKEFKRAYSKINRNKFWNNIISKTSYIVEILYTNLSKEDVCDLENLFIEEYGRRDLGTGTLVNMTNGGDGNLKPSLKRRKEHSLLMTGSNNPMFNKRFFGKDNPNYGNKWNDDKKLLLSNFRKTLNLKGEKSYNWGRKLSKETKLKISKNHNKPSGKNHYYSKGVLNLETGIIYYSAREASEAHNIKYTTLRAMLNGSNPNRTSLIYI